jgi:transcriptional regulator with XRE-family HTH domain
MTFKDLRISSGETTEKIAKKLRIKEETYRKYEYSMRLPSATILAQMPVVLQCSFEEVVQAYNYSKEVQLKRYGKTNP